MPDLESSRLNGVAIITKTYIHTHANTSKIKKKHVAVIDIYYFFIFSLLF